MSVSEAMDTSVMPASQHFTEAAWHTSALPMLTLVMSLKDMPPFMEVDAAMLTAAASTSGGGTSESAAESAV